MSKTLAQWRASGDPVPVIWSHDWGSADSHIGVAYAKDMKQTDRGLSVKGRLDIEDIRWPNVSTSSCSAGR